MVVAEPVPLPYRIRPLGVRIAAAAASGAIVFVVAVLWLSMSDEVQATFTLFQRITLLAGLRARCSPCSTALFRTSAVATDDGLRIINGYKARELEWAEIVRLTLQPQPPVGAARPRRRHHRLGDGDPELRRVSGPATPPRSLPTVIAEHSRTPRND